jgi:hypothetical protein
MKRLVALLALLSLQGAQAFESERVSESTLGVTAFRLGAQADLRYGLRFPLFEREDSPLFQGTGLKIVAT